MVTLSTDYLIPNEIMKPMLLEAAVDLCSLSIYREVSQEFKTVADSPSFLHALLVRLKGDQYSDIFYAQNPKNFFFIERDLLRSMKKHEKLQSISSIGLKSLALRSFFLSSGHYFRFSTPCIEALRTVSCRDQDAWNICIEELTKELTKWEFPFQVMCILDSDSIPSFKKIESVYREPNAIMLRLVKEFSLTDMYFADTDEFIVHTENKTFDPYMLEEAITEPEEYEKIQIIAQIQQLLENLIIQIIPGNPPQIGIGVTGPLFKKIADQLQDATKPLKNHIECSLKSDNYKFILGALFPTIWPNNLRELGKLRGDKALVYWLSYCFVNSIKVEKGENGQPSALKCNDALCRFIYDHLKNQRLDFKGFIEQNYKNNPIFHYFIKFFPGIWDDNPTLNPS